MAKKIKGVDIIEDNHLANAIADANELLGVYKQLDAQIIKTAKDSKKIAQGKGANTAKNIQGLNQALTKTTQLKKSAIAVDKEAAAVKKQLDAATDEEVRGKLRLQEATKNQKTLLKEEIALSDKQLGTLKRLAIENAKLRRERANLNLETKKGQARLKEINSALDKNNARIQANSDKLKKQKLNVGAYGKAVGKATSLMKGFGATMLAAFSFQAIKGFFTSSVAAFQVQEKAVAKVTQALKTTGNAVGKTTEELQAMASNLQGTTLFGDEQILNDATAQLLTFTNIAGSQFERTQQVALDLATVLDGDLKSSSIQLGKALNDPVKNLSALGRAGIQFSDSQKEVINSLAKSGNLAEAQNVILVELEKQYGGQAAAAADADGGITQLSNAFGDFKEQVGKTILESMKPMIKNLKDFFSNLKAEDIENFTKKIIGFGKVLANLVKGFLAFKAAQKAVGGLNTVLKVFGKSLNAIPIAAFIAALVILAPLVWDWVDSMVNAKTASNELDRVAEETNKRLQEEKIALEEVGAALNETVAGSEERLKIINEINAKYGTTLENLEDETEFVIALGKAYKEVVDQLERKIEAEVQEEFLRDLITQRAEINRAIDEIKSTDVADRFKEGFLADADAQLAVINGRIEVLKAAIGETKALEGSTVEDIDTGGGGGSGSGKKLKDERKDIDNLNRSKIELLKTNAELIKQEQSAVLTGAQTLAQEALAEQIEAERLRREAEEKARLERLEALKKMREESLAIIKQITNDLAGEIDKRIALRQKGIEEKETEVSRLQTLASQGNTDAAEAIKAEKIAIAKEKIEIEALEKRKKNLLISVAGLERASQLIGSGNGNPFATAGSEIKDFLGNLSSLSEGTDYNIGQTLGRAQRSGTDGHLAWVDKDEKLLSIRNSRKLKGMHQDEVTRRALGYNDDFVNGDAMSVTSLQAMSDRNILSALEKNTKAINNIRIVQQHIDLNTGKETIVDGNKTTNIDHNPKTFKV